MDISILLKKISSKKDNSRQYNILLNRLKKSLKKELKFREIRCREESLEKAKEFSKKTTEETLEFIKILSVKNVIKK